MQGGAANYTPYPDLCYREPGCGFLLPALTPRPPSLLALSNKYNITIKITIYIKMYSGTHLRMLLL